jgi:hypothetical protein
MKQINLLNYALLHENKSLGYYSLNEAAGEVSTNTISIQESDSPEVKAVKKLIIDNAGKAVQDPEFLKINTEAANLVASGSPGPSRLTIKIGDKEYAISIYVANGKAADGKSGVYIDFDSTARVIEGLDMNFLATQFRKGVEGSSIFGLNFGTDEDKLGALAGAIYRIGYDKNADIPEIFKALGTAYQSAYNESLMDAVEADFSGTPEVLARAVYGDTVTDGEISAAMGVDFLQSLVVDIAIGLCTFGVGAAARGLIRGGKILNSVKQVGKLKKGIQAFQSGALTGSKFSNLKNTALIKNTSTLAKGLKDPAFKAAQKGYAAIQGAGALFTKVGAGAGVGLAAGQGLAAAASDDPEQQEVQNFTSEDAAFAFCTQIKDLAKGYTDGANELQITFMITTLSPKTAQAVMQSWSKNFQEDGDFYEYCVASEISGDMLSLCNGYWAGITGTGPLAAQVEKISQGMQKEASQAAQGGTGGGFTAVTESINFTRLKTFNDFYKK